MGGKNYTTAQLYCTNLYTKETRNYLFAIRVHFWGGFISLEQLFKVFC